MRKLLPILFCLLLAACNLPIANSGNDLDNQAATIVAMTLEAQGTPTRESENTPLPTTATLAATGSSTPTITPTYSVPMLNVNETTNCRTGPGQNYKIITSFATGASVEIAGRYPTNNYWIVKIPGSDETCWMWGDYSTATGSYWVVPSVTPPPTSAPSSVSKPSSLTYTYFCSFNGVNSDVSVTLSWIDKADDELGYRVFRDNAKTAELAANSSAYSEVIAANATQTLSYSVAAYNAAGESERATISFSCQ